MDVPPPLAERRQWMCWREEYGTKVPYQPNGIRAKSNDSATWYSLEECQQASRRVAYVFDKDDPFIGVDLDDCLTDGVWEPWAQAILNRFEGVAYAEISPSGKGVKLITRGAKPDGSRCTNRKGVECYDHSRFWTMTGNCLGVGFETIGDGQAAVDWLLENYLSGGRGETGKKREAAPGGSFELLARAEAYIDACRPESKGNLRNAAFQNAGHLHALVGADGVRLSDTDVYNLLKRWNLRNTEQLRDDELREAAVNGRKNGSPPADKPPKEIVKADDSDVDLSGILAGVVNSLPSDVPFSPGDFPRDAIPTSGIIGQTIEYNLATALYPQPELAFSGALALMSVITGRKVETEYGTRTNLYILAIGESGTGKEHARKINKELLYHCGAESMLGSERLASSAGLTREVADKLACLLQLDEIGKMLATMNSPKSSHLWNIAPVLMQLYSSSDSIWIGDAYADAKKTPTIIQPHAVLYGTATPESFWTNMTSESVADGLLGRMIAFECPGYVDRQRPAKVQPADSLIEKIRFWCDLKPGGIDISRPQPLKVEHSQEALERFEEHQDGIQERRKNEEPQHRAVWSRSGEKTAKLALIFACSRQQSLDVRIEIEDMNRAIKIVNWLTRRMLKQAYDYVSSNFVEEHKKRALRILSTEMDRSTFCRKTQWLKSRERNELLADLVDQGLVAVRTVETEGRSKTYLRRVE